MVSFQFTRRSRLLTSKDFNRVFRSGRSCKVGCLSVHVAETEDDEVRLGLVVSRRVGKSHDRNRLKRIVREAFRLDIAPAAKGYDVVVRFSAGAGKTPSRKVRDEFLLATKRLGLYSPPTGPQSPESDPKSEH